MKKIKINNKLRFNQKIYLFITFSFLLFSLIVFLLTILLIQKVENKSAIIKEQEKISKEVEDLNNGLMICEDLAFSISVAPSIQKFLSSEKSNTTEYFNTCSKALDNINNINASNSNIHLITILKADKETYIYKADKYELSNKSLLDIYFNDINKSCFFGKGTMQISYSNSYFPQSKEKLLNIYFPIYSTIHINKIDGYLCFSIENLMLNKIDTFGDQSSLITEIGDVIVSSNNQEIPSLEHLSSKSNYFENNNKFYFYKRIPNSSLILVNSIYSKSITNKIPQIVLPLTISIIILLGICLFLLHLVIKRAYLPMEEVTKTINTIAENKNIGHRIDASNFGADFKKIANGFNTMMDEINSLIEKVKEDQKTKERLHYYMLQSQIKPHFLYNALECIHWQALADNNKKTSKLVLALGNYYKIGLSNGAETITIKEELELVKNYLIIQNMRFDNIVKYKIDIDASVYNYLIPKSSLQPLIENAIYHGIRIKMGNTGYIKIEGKDFGDFATIKIIDSGSNKNNEIANSINSLLKGDNPAKGYGIYNVNKRLQLYGGKKCHLKYYDNEQGGITVKIVLNKINQKGIIND